MASITVVSRKQYSGPDADKSSVTGAAGETYTATDTGTRYTWDPNASIWIIGAGSSVIPLDAPAYTWIIGDLVNNNVLQVDGLDLTAIVPVGTVMVLIAFSTKGAVNKQDYIYQDSGAPKLRNQLYIFRKVSNYWETNLGLIAIDSDRLLDYKIDFVADCKITVLGYVL